MSRIISKKRALLTAALTSVVVVAVAVAYWTTSGSGTGSGDVAASNGTLQLTGDLDNDLAPGVSSPVTITVKNPSQSNLYVTSTSLNSIDITGETNNSGGCSNTWFVETSTSPVAQNTMIPARAGMGDSGGPAAVTLTGKHTVKFNNSSDNQDDCKNADVGFNVTSN